MSATKRQALAELFGLKPKGSSLLMSSAKAFLGRLHLPLKREAIHKRKRLKFSRSAVSYLRCLEKKCAAAYATAQSQEVDRPFAQKINFARMVTVRPVKLPMS